MASLSVAAQRAAIYAALQTVTAITHTYAYQVPDPNLPCLMVLKPQRVALDAADFDDGGEATWTVLALWRGDDWQRAQDALDDLLDVTGASSIYAALVANATLKYRVVGEVTVTNYGPGSYSGRETWGAEINLTMQT